ncbi:hypothetical protein ACFL6K_05700 [Candidatus Latescibacterota bacterium]
MRRFADILSRINERLVLPQPLKYRIMKEITADLEDTFAVYVQQGMGENEAETKAMNKIAADDTVINQLMDIHETPVRKILRRISDKLRCRIELLLWISLLVVIGFSITAFIYRSENLAASPFNWLTGGFIVSMFGISVWKFYELYIKRDHSPQKIHRGLSLLIFICGITMLTAILGFFVEIQESISVIQHSTEITGKAVEFLFRSFSVLIFGFVTAVIWAVVWLLMTLKTLGIEDYANAFSFYATEKKK